MKRPELGVSTGSNQALLPVKNTTVEAAYYVQRAKEATERRENQTKKDRRGLNHISVELELEIATTLQTRMLPLTKIAKMHNVTVVTVQKVQENLWVRKYDKKLGEKP
jgi:hypothetical protein